MAISAFDVLMLQIASTVWVVYGILPVGVTILAGRPKIGKSWLAFQIALAVATGTPLWGLKVTQGRVLYLALEDNLSRLQARMKLQGWPADPNLPIDFITMDEFIRTFGAFHKGGAQRLESLILNGQYSLVVIDTLSRAFTGIRDMDQNQEVTKALSPVQTMAMNTNTAVLILDHHNKSAVGKENDPINDILGSTAKAAVLDTAWGLYRERGKADSKLKMTGREVEEQTITLSMDKSTMTWQGQNPTTTKPFQLSKTQMEILRFLRDFGASKHASIYKNTGLDRANSFRELKDLVAWGEVDYDTKTGEYSIP